MAGGGLTKKLAPMADQMELNQFEEHKKNLMIAKDATSKVDKNELAKLMEKENPLPNFLKGLKVIMLLLGFKLDDLTDLPENH